MIMARIITRRPLSFSMAAASTMTPIISGTINVRFSLKTKGAYRKIWQIIKWQIKRLRNKQKEKCPVFYSNFP